MVASQVDKKQRVAAIIGVLIPIIFIVIVAVIAYVPSQFINPKHDFLYTKDYSSNNYYEIRAKHLVEVPVLTEYDDNNYRDSYNYRQKVPTIYRYDVASDTTESITFEEARQLTLSSSAKSPDGYKLEEATGSGGFLFWSSYSGSDGDPYLQKGLASKKLSLPGDSYDFELIGWIQ